MFAVVEFEQKECSIVPFCWLLEENKKCYWPKAFTEEIFMNLVKSQKNPRPSWAKYTVVKVFYVTESFDDAETFLRKIIEQSGSSSDTGDVGSIKALSLKNFDADATKIMNINNQEKRHRDDFSPDNSDYSSGSSVEENAKQKKNESVKQLSRSSEPSTSRHIINSDFTSSDEEIPNKKLKPGPVQKFPLFNKSLLHDQNNTACSASSTSAAINLRFCSEPVRQQPTITLQSPSSSNSLASTVTLDSNGSVPVNDHDGSFDHFGFRHHLIKSLQQIINVMHQNNQKIDEILRLVSQNSSNIEAPHDLPNFPMESRRDFKNLEQFLRNQERNVQYLKSRLACIGGANVRACVMNMLKYLMTNKLAMNYNWAGRQKKSFKETILMKVIMDATRQSFKHRCTDREIEDAVKDWLKLAKARHEYGRRQVPTLVV